MWVIILHTDHYSCLWLGWGRKGEIEQIRYICDARISAVKTALRSSLLNSWTRRTWTRAMAGLKESYIDDLI